MQKRKRNLSQSMDTDTDGEQTAVATAMVVLPMDTQESNNEVAQQQPAAEANTDVEMSPAVITNGAATPPSSADAVDDAEELLFRPEATFSYTVENIFELTGSVFSPPTYARTVPWRIMVVPNDKGIGFFLQCNGENDSSAWSCHAIADLRIVSHMPGVEPYTRARIRHMFYAKENDYGYSNFIPYAELRDPSSKGYVNEHGGVIFEVHVIADAPHGVFWDSKKHTGYVGLKNQGATCYMNSLLQTLYFTNELRRVVYRMPTEADDSAKSVGLSLQRVFHDLQFSDRPVGTKKLTKSFGWETLDSLMQHDVQEFLRVLLDKLESKMKGTCLEGSIPALFEGKMLSYIKCKNVDYNSTRTESFYDIQLNLKDHKNIYDSFEAYVKSETLEGDNKYDAGAHGLQEASKGIIFTRFPPVLHLHLMRCIYDPITDSSVKYNDRFEFFEHINLDKYLAEQDASKPADYVLHAVLVHSGDNHGGHYVAYINPKANGRWYKFDDDVVAVCRKAEAIDMNFGGIDDENSFHIRSSSAYMLVYIRKSELPRILSEIAQSELSPELIERLDLEARLEAARRRERNEAHLTISVHVLLEEYFGSQMKHRVYDFEQMHQRIFKFRATQTVEEFYDTLAESFGVHTSRLRVWSTITNQLQRFTYFDRDADPSCTLEEVTGNQKSWLIYLELVKPGCSKLLQRFQANNQLLIFMKYYDAANGRLTYLGSSTHNAHERFVDLLPQANALIGLPAGTPLSVYDDFNNKRIVDLQNALGEQLHAIESGQHAHLLIFELAQLDAAQSCELPTIEDYYTDQYYRVEVAFYERSNLNEPDFTLELSTRYNYEQLARAVGNRLNCDPQKLQFFVYVHTYKEANCNPISHLYKGTMKDLIPYGKQPGVKKLLYQRLTLSIHELDNKRQFKCVYITPDLREERELVLYPNQDDTVAALLTEAAAKLSPPEKSPKKLRLLKIVNHKIVQVFDEQFPLESLCKAESMTTRQTVQKIFRIEDIAADEQQLASDELLVPVLHYTKETFNHFGVPILQKLKHGEPYGAFKQRLQRRLNVHDKEWKTYKCTVVTTGHTFEVTDDLPVDIGVYRCNSPSPGQLPFFGLDHANKSPKRSNWNFAEKAIKIYN